MPSAAADASPMTHALVTGANGFLGRALCRRLVARGVATCGLDVQERPAAGFHGTYIRASVTDLDELEHRTDEAHVEVGPGSVLFHLAGLSHVGQCAADPQTAYSVNVTGTFNVLEWSRRRGLRRVVFPSTALVYRTPAPGAIAEGDEARPRSLYAGTKLAAEALVAGYAASYGQSSCVARLGNVYGPGGPADSVIAIVVDQVRRGGPVRLRTLTPVRDFIYRDDVARALEALGESTGQAGCDTVNVASGDAVSIRALAEAACVAGGISPDVAATGEAVAGSGNVDSLMLSIQRITARCGWRPEWTLTRGLKTTIDGEDVFRNG